MGYGDPAVTRLANPYGLLNPSSVEGHPSSLILDLDLPNRKRK
jgi:hypothetical protein